MWWRWLIKLSHLNLKSYSGLCACAETGSACLDQPPQEGRETIINRSLQLERQNSRQYDMQESQSSQRRIWQSQWQEADMGRLTAQGKLGLITYKTFIQYRSSSRGWMLRNSSGWHSQRIEMFIRFKCENRLSVSYKMDACCSSLQKHSPVMGMI